MESTNNKLQSENINNIMIEEINNTNDHDLNLDEACQDLGKFLINILSIYIIYNLLLIN
jgi:hypothetical protein